MEIIYFIGLLVIGAAFLGALAHHGITLDYLRARIMSNVNNSDGRKIKQGNKQKETREWLKFIALVLGGVWVLIVFSFGEYKEREIYRSTASNVTVSCELEYVGKCNDFCILRVNNKIKSNSKVAVSVFDSPYKMIGGTRNYDKKTTEEYYEKIREKEATNKEYSAHRDYIISDPTLLSVGRLFSSSTALEPNEAIDYSFTLAVNKHYDHYQYSMNLRLARDISHLGIQASKIENTGISYKLLKYPKEKADVYSYTDKGSTPEIIDDENIGQYRKYLSGIGYTNALALCSIHKQR